MLFRMPASHSECLGLCPDYVPGSIFLFMHTPESSGDDSSNWVL